MSSWIDLHCHLDKLEEGPETALELAASAGVERVITIGTEPADHPVVVSLAQKHFPKVACTLGVHPHEATSYTPDVEKFMRQHLADSYVVAVGEIGLDYYYNHSPREKQIEVFKQQMDLAAEFGLPVQIHTRDAEEDTIEILKSYQGRVGGVLHCFTGSQNLAMKALDFGFNISISGVVTFKNAEELRQTVRDLPLDRIHVETDSPFLAPVPLRGKPNTPAYVVHTAEKVAELKGISLEDLKKATAQNASKAFPKLSL
jgi:TatD DNase family protein